MTTWLHVARQLDPQGRGGGGGSAALRQVAEELGRPVRHVYRRRACSPRRVRPGGPAAGPDARRGLLAQAQRESTLDALTVPLRGRLRPAGGGDPALALPAMAVRVEHLRREGPRVGGPHALRVLRRPRVCEPRGVGAGRRAVHLAVEGLSVHLLVPGEDLRWPGLYYRRTGVVSPRARRVPPRTVLSDARSAPVLSCWEAVGPPADHLSDTLSSAK